MKTNKEKFYLKIADRIVVIRFILAKHHRIKGVLLKQLNPFLAKVKRASRLKPVYEVVIDENFKGNYLRIGKSIFVEKLNKKAANILRTTPLISPYEIDVILQNIISRILKFTHTFIFHGIACDDGTLLLFKHNSTHNVIGDFVHADKDCSQIIYPILSFHNGLLHAYPNPRLLSDVKKENVLIKRLTVMKFDGRRWRSDNKEAHRSDVISLLSQSLFPNRNKEKLNRFGRLISKKITTD